FKIILLYYIVIVTFFAFIAHREIVGQFDMGMIKNYTWLDFFFEISMLAFFPCLISSLLIIFLGAQLKPSLQSLFSLFWLGVSILIIAVVILPAWLSHGGSTWLDSEIFYHFAFDIKVIGLLLICFAFAYTVLCYIFKVREN
ncbi:MAG: hypothetical protein KDK66_06920, partial [Deltaproteobacteria bacterium]|nr:hypothetical protein [Deltaproteobacteria bacterium]